MLTNYIKIAIRNIQRNKLHSFINIIGLSIGMACAIMLLLFVRDEFSYDKYNSKRDRIYMVQELSWFIDREDYFYTTPFVIGPALKDEYPAIEEFVRVYMADRMFFKDKNKEIIGEDGICYTDPTVFRVFDANFIYGSPEGALDKPHTIVLSEALAKKYFGDKNPVGKILSESNGINYTVSGVFKDLPKNTFTRYTALIPMTDLVKFKEIKNFESREPAAFYRNNIGRNYTYILLHKKSDIRSITEDSDRFREKYFAEFGKQQNYDLKLFFKPLTDVYLDYKATPDSKPNSFLSFSSFLSAMLFLIIAIINYMNLATARSAHRAREVGVRKVLGADRRSLIIQFISESIIITAVAFLISLVLIELFLPDFNSLVGKDLKIEVFTDPVIYTGLIILILFVGLSAGSYPAFFLSSYMPAKVIKGEIKSGKGNRKLRNALVLVQFSVSITVIILSLSIYGSTKSMLQMDLGFNRKNILFFAPNSPDAVNSLAAYKNAIIGNSEILAASRSNSTAGIGGYRSNFLIEDSKGKNVTRSAIYLTVDYDFIDLMEMDVVEGRSFSREISSDYRDAFLVNETFVKKMGWKDSPVGKRVIFGTKQGKVIGVLKDFYFQSLHIKLEPMILMMKGNSPDVNMPVLSIKISPEHSEKTIEFLKKKWFEVNPVYPFEYHYLEDTIGNLYKTDETLSRLLIYIAVLTIFISCLGLFGLSSFVAEKRTKEIAIRKIHGASVMEIFINLAYDFLKIVFVSGIIAVIIIFFLVAALPDNYPYAPEFSLAAFIITLCIPLFFALMTVSYHAVKAALTDPVKALRYE